MPVVNLKKIFIFLSLLLTFNFSLSQPFVPKGKLCDTREGRIQHIQEISAKQFDWILQKVERVPPDIEKYLIDEYLDSINTRNESRFQKVVSNQYYYPWQLRESIQKFQEEVKNGFTKQIGYGSLKKLPHESEILYYTNLLHRHTDVGENYDSYRNFDRTRQTQYFNSNKDDYMRGFSPGIYKKVIEDLISCSFKK